VPEANAALATDILKGLLEAALTVMRPAGWIGSAGVVLGVSVAFASIERSIEVAQPIVTEETICIHNVTYITLSTESWAT
jgi:hypothetical protein